MQKYQLAKPYITEKEKEYVNKVLSSGVLSLGPETKKFEQEFAKKIGVKYAVAVNSGTSGLHLAMLGSGIGPGDEVITSPFSFIASANCILYAGAEPVFCDIDETTCNIDPSKIEAKITKKTKAILVVHILGQPCYMNPILKIAKKHNLKIIEDACESLLSTYYGKIAGTFGESTVFAFYPNKQMTTGGEGGIIATNSLKRAELFLSLRNQGRAKNMQWLDHQYLGYNYRITEMQAACGLAQLEKIDWMINQRQKIAKIYTREIKEYPGILLPPQIAKGNTHTWFVYVVRLLKFNANKRDALILAMEKQGIQTKPYFPSIHLFSFYKNKFGFKKGDFPISEKASEQGIALPFYIGLQENDICFIVETLIKLAKNIK